MLVLDTRAEVLYIQHFNDGARPILCVASAQPEWLEPSPLLETTPSAIAGPALGILRCYNTRGQVTRKGLQKPTVAARSHDSSSSDIAVLERGRPGDVK
jgi:hypothetical protein